MVWTREEYISHMTLGNVGRELFCELFGPLHVLTDEWRGQGAAESEIDLSDFGWESVKYAVLPCQTGAVTPYAPRLLYENAEEAVSIDELGRKVRLIKRSATIPLPLDYPVAGWADWEKIKKWYQYSDSRIDREKLQGLRSLQREGTLVTAWMPGGFDEPRQLMGEEALCIAYYEEPELIRDILDTIATTCRKVFEQVSDYVTIDNLCVHEDMAGKSGPLVGDRQIDEFIGPYYRKIWEPVKAAGGKLFSQDSDGNMTPVIDAFLRAGVNVMYPLEPMAGMDMVALRKKYGKRLAFKGGIDKFALRGGREDIRRELEYKCGPTMRGGGTVFALDHRIPNGVSIDNYRYYVSLGRELLGLPPLPQPCPHIRMAF